MVVAFEDFLREEVLGLLLRDELVVGQVLDDLEFLVALGSFDVQQHVQLVLVELDRVPVL